MVYRHGLCSLDSCGHSGLILTHEHTAGGVEAADNRFVGRCCIDARGAFHYFEHAILGEQFAVVPFHAGRQFGQDYGWFAAECACCCPKCELISYGWCIAGAEGYVYSTIEDESHARVDT